jgi:hypothetical protein
LNHVFPLGDAAAASAGSSGAASAGRGAPCAIQRNSNVAVRPGQFGQAKGHAPQREALGKIREALDGRALLRPVDRHVEGLGQHLALRGFGWLVLEPQQLRQHAALARRP